jgi:hypothetical protein
MNYLPDYFLKFSQTRHEEKESLKIGNFRLLDNPIFCEKFLSFVASNQQKFPTFEQWQKFLKADYRTPQKPDRENPFLYKNTEYLGRYDLEARTYRAYIFSKKREQYLEQVHSIEQKKTKQRNIKNKYGNHQAGYCAYVFDRLEYQEQNFLDQYQKFSIPESQRLLHTYISGGTGSGKSELMKNLLHHYLTENTKTALVLIDPHGKIAHEVAQFKENKNNNRLVFIRPDMKENQSPIFNIFDSADVSSPQALDIATQEIVGAFREILQEVGFTPQMETLLKPCIATLLLYPEGNLYHLQQFMEKEENGELLAFSDNNLPNPAQRNFLKTDFLKSAYAPSRQSIRTKIQSLLNSQIFLNFTIGKSTFSISEAIQQKKLLIFSLSRNSGSETSDTMGRLILANLQSLAMQRANLSSEELKKAPPIHLFIDECQHYITPSIETILTETRKYKLYLTLANQFLDQIQHRRTRNAIKGNTALKITGRQTEPDTLATIAKITRTNPEEIQNLQIGQYHIKAGEQDSLKISGKTHLLDNKNAMNADEWETTKTYQENKYYCKINNLLPIQTPTEKQEFKRTKKRKLN